MRDRNLSISKMPVKKQRLRSLETQNRNVIDVDVCEDVLVDSVTNISDDVSNTNFVMSAETNSEHEDDPAKLTLAYERLFEIPRTIVERFAAHVKYLDISHNKIVLFVISQFPSLVHLDDRAITDDQRMEAQKVFKKPFFERFMKPGGSSISNMMGRSVTWSSISTFWNKNQNADENRRNLMI
ncbi:hypothetical protein EVAR_47228_1 [Eumeta japonica]|uniref:Uncharacterized protein n=1 Tax=Eumeta variegata TaxID=151549 RepID=A0A4C1XRE5_EUMVA|nr:hypothetical protein EVAR_47228_1 [Eumeta japonica]